MSETDRAKAARRLLWAMVVGLVTLNVVLYLVYAGRSRASPARGAPSPDAPRQFPPPP